MGQNSDGVKPMSVGSYGLQDDKISYNSNNIGDLLKSSTLRDRSTALSHRKLKRDVDMNSANSENYNNYNK
jgi:hypothetical protein